MRSASRSSSSTTKALRPTPRDYVFAQIVDEQRHLVLGNQVTPIAIKLDGLPHSVSRSLEGVAAAI